MTRTKPRRGRPSLKPSARRVTLNARVHPDTLRQLRRMARLAYASVGEIVDWMCEVWP